MADQPLSRRRSDLTHYSRRLSPTEVAAHWFRRGNDFGRVIHEFHPDFPRAAPDGLYLLDDVKLWFDQFHGKRQTLPISKEAEAEALRIARYGRRQNSTSSY